MKVGTTVKQVTVEFNTLDDLDTACFVPGFAEAVKNIIEAEQSKAEKGEDASGQKGDVVAVEMYYAYPKDGDDPVIMHSNVYGDRVDHPTGLSDAEEEWEPYPVMNSDDEKTLPGVLPMNLNYVHIANPDLFKDGLRLTLRDSVDSCVGYSQSILAGVKGGHNLEVVPGCELYLSPRVVPDRFDGIFDMFG